MKTFLSGLLIGWLACGAAWAQGAAGGPVGVIPDERAMARYPANWVAQPPVHKEQLTVVRLLPPGQSPQDFTQAITIERYEAMHQSPKEFLLSRADSSRSTCDGMLAGDVVEGTVNGYKSASLRFTCTRSHRNNKSGAVSLTAVAGRDALHVISWYWLGDPVSANQIVPVPAQTVSEWDAFAKTIIVCNINDSSHPCPGRK